MMWHPILFSGEMVRKVLTCARCGAISVAFPCACGSVDFVKTVTRRVVKPQPPHSCTYAINGASSHALCFGPNGECVPPTARSMDHRLPCPYGQPGDRLIVSMEIPGFPSYCAGSNGVIYSKARGEWRPLSAHGGKPYPTVTVMDGKRKTTRAVHSLVCTAFYGAPTAPGLQVRHLDGNPANNQPLNLAWGTQEENWLDRKAHGNGIEGEKHPAALFSDEERRWINWIVGKGIASQRHVARILGVAQSSIWEIVNHNTFPPPKQEIPDGRIPPITLEVTGVRVERVDDITEESAIREGVEKLGEFPNITPWRNYLVKQPAGAMNKSTAGASFMTLWDSLNAKRGFGWDKNPWVWVVEFRRVKP